MYVVAEPVAAEITVVGAEDQIAALPAKRRVPVGMRGQGRGERAEDRARVIRAGRIAGHAVEAAVKLALQGEVDARADAARFQGAYRAVAEGLMAKFPNLRQVAITLRGSLSARAKFRVTIVRQALLVAHKSLAPEKSSKRLERRHRSPLR